VYVAEWCRSLYHIGKYGYCTKYSLPLQILNTFYHWFLNTSLTQLTSFPPRHS